MLQSMSEALKIDITYLQCGRGAVMCILHNPPSPSLTLMEGVIVLPIVKYF